MKIYCTKSKPTNWYFEKERIYYNYCNFRLLVKILKNGKKANQEPVKTMASF